MLALAFAGCASAAEPADDRSCDVYRAFYVAVAPETTGTLAPQTRRPRWIKDWLHGPDTFERDTGEMQTTEVEGEAFEFPVREQFEVETDAFFDVVRDGPARAIQHCFGADSDAAFFSGSVAQLAARSARSQELRYPELPPSMWRLSRIGFSADWRYALLYADLECHGWCGGGGFYLFERDQAGWRLIGDKWVWVA